MKSKKEHNNKTAYMNTYTYLNSRANSAHTLQSICNVLLEIIKYDNDDDADYIINDIINILPVFRQFA